LAACFAGLILVVAWIEMPFGELSLLIAYLFVSSVGSSIVGFFAYRMSEARRRSIRTKVLIAHGLGALVVIVNIYVAAQMMFISAHDLGMLMLLLVFCALFSVTFGAAVASRLTQAVQTLAEGARQVSLGNLHTRVVVPTNDELSDLATSFNEMVAQVSEAAVQRERADDARRQLVAAVSHDLRTPLTAIRAMLEALDDGVVDDAATIARYHATMRAQVEHLNRLIDDLFELSQIDAGGYRYDLRRVDLSAIVGDAVEGFAMTAAGRGVRLCFAADGPTPARLDPDKIGRLLNNLLDNALRHSPDGGSIDVRVTGAGASAQVVVRDHGEGIPSDDLPHVFDRFFRGERSRSRAYGGAGLGLAIAKGIVEGHAGHIWAENASDGGARFTFSLPIDR
jgi:signal transduction histidine kinase